MFVLGQCIKIYTESRDKVFINICHSKELYPPEDVSDEEFELIVTGESPMFVIPMAIGLEKKAKDKSKTLILN